MARHNELGRRGEELARKFLEKAGFRILDTNWRHEKDELDIVAMDGETLVIVEVKTRSTDYFGDPSEAVGKAKEKFLIRAAEAYLETNNLDTEIRYDIISVILTNGGHKIRHIKDAFYPE
jgi:putative endonuclease